MKAYLARQPIYTLNKKIYGYELLYRSDEKTNSYNNNIDGETATRTVVSDAITSFGLEKISNGKPVFINFNYTLLMCELLEMLDKSNFVIEILEDTVIDEPLIERIRAKSEEGYVFAIDDYIGNECFKPILPYVSIIKVDFSLITTAQACSLAQDMFMHKKILLAEKIETDAQFICASNSGYTLFQGYFFDKPVVLSENIIDTQSSTCIRVFNELNSRLLNFDALSKIIRNDVTLSYKLLKHCNSLKFYRGHNVNSIRIALIRMGTEEVRRWMSLIFMRDITTQICDENIKSSLVRGIMSEWLASYAKLNSETAFLIGMFSMIDTIANDNISNLLNNISVSKEIASALHGEPGPYCDIIEFVRAYEKGEWENTMLYMTKHRIRLNKLSEVYLDALEYADSLFDT